MERELGLELRIHRDHRRSRGLKDGRGERRRRGYTEGSVGAREAVDVVSSTEVREIAVVV
jgi:hypothetical protein